MLRYFVLTLFLRALSFVHCVPVLVLTTRRVAENIEAVRKSMRTRQVLCLFVFGAGVGGGRETEGNSSHTIGAEEDGFFNLAAMIRRVIRGEREEGVLQARFVLLFSVAAGDHVLFDDDAASRHCR